MFEHRTQPLIPREQFFALLWGDLLLSRLLGARAPTSTEIEQRGTEATAAFLNLYPAA